MHIDVSACLESRERLLPSYKMFRGVRPLMSVGNKSSPCRAYFVRKPKKPAG